MVTVVKISTNNYSRRLCWSSRVERLSLCVCLFVGSITVSVNHTLLLILMQQANSLRTTGKPPCVSRSRSAFSACVSRLLLSRGPGS